MKRETKQAFLLAVRRGLFNFCYSVRKNTVPALCLALTSSAALSLWFGVWNNVMARSIMLRGIALAVATFAVGAALVCVFALLCWILAQAREE